MKIQNLTHVHLQSADIAETAPASVRGFLVSEARVHVCVYVCFNQTPNLHVFDDLET